MKNKKYELDGKRLFVKYQNRKIYDPKESKYVNLDFIAKMPTGSFMVMDHATKQDITTQVLLSALTSHFEKNPEVFANVKDEMVARFLNN